MSRLTAIGVTIAAIEGYSTIPVGVPLDLRYPPWHIGSREKKLQFPNAVVLNAVGRRNTQRRAKRAQKQVCKRAQKSVSAGRELPKKVRRGLFEGIPR